MVQEVLLWLILIFRSVGPVPDHKRFSSPSTYISGTGPCSFTILISSTVSGYWFHTFPNAIPSSSIHIPCGPKERVVMAAKINQLATSSLRCRLPHQIRW